MSISNLVDWAKKGGTLISPSVEFKEVSSGNFGAIYKGEKDESEKSLEGNQIRLPIKLAVTLDTAIESLNEGTGDHFGGIAKDTQNINSVLKLYLARERTSSCLAKSFYEPYLSLLPKLSDINSPYCWTSEQKSYIKGTNLGNSLKGNIGQLVEEWWQVINMLPQEMAKPTEHFVNMKFYYEFKFYTDEDIYNYFIVDEPKHIDNWTGFPSYLWASLILKSRSFPAHLLNGHADGEREFKQDEAMLLPVIDLLNHNMGARVNWSVSQSVSGTSFNFKSDSATEGLQLYNNYGMKGNEELLLAYGFCIENNSADSAALKIKVPLELLPELESQGMRLPSVGDYTTSVIRTDEQPAHDNNYKQYEDGLLFFVTNDHLPDNLVQLFQFLVKNKWEDKLTLRMKLAGLNQLRQAIDSKSNILSSLTVPDKKDPTLANIKIYILSQKKIFLSTIKKIKHLEKDLLADPNNKKHLISLKTVHKKDIKFQQSLLISLGVTSYDTILESQFQDQCWLLYLMRCYNRDEYITSKEDEESNFLPQWIKQLFIKLSEETEITAVEVLNYKDLYQTLVPRLAEVVPEIYGKGKWGVKEMIVSAKLLDNISFVRGKEQECILVEPFNEK